MGLLFHSSAWTFLWRVLTTLVDPMLGWIDYGFQRSELICNLFFLFQQVPTHQCLLLQSVRMLLPVSCSHLCGWHHGLFSMAKLCTYSLLCFAEFFRYLWPIQGSQLLLPPTSDSPYMSVFIHRPLPYPAENSIALPCKLYYLASWDTSAFASAKLWMKSLFLLKAG